MVGFVGLGGWPLVFTEHIHTNSCKAEEGILKPASVSGELAEAWLPMSWGRETADVRHHIQREMISIL